MNPAQISSRCECQAVLFATLDEARQVLSGSARRKGDAERAPAHTIGGADPERFDVAWACPFCGRNTLRSFHVSSIRRAS